MDLSRYCKIFPHPDDPSLQVLFSTRTACLLTVPTELLNDIKRGALPIEEREAMAEHGMLVESLDIEQREMLGYIDQMNRLNKAFRAIVVMSLDCNLACGYCFEGTTKGETLSFHGDRSRSRGLHHPRTPKAGTR